VQDWGGKYASVEEAVKAGVSAQSIVRPVSNTLVAEVANASASSDVDSVPSRLCGNPLFPTPGWVAQHSEPVYVHDRQEYLP
jgi:hypothetical protein